MQRPNASPQVAELLRVVSNKLGIPQETLQQELQSGKFDKAFANMKPQETAKFQQVLSNPQLLNQMMNSKQAQALYQKLTKS